MPPAGCLVGRGTHRPHNDRGAHGGSGSRPDSKKQPKHTPMLKRFRLPFAFAEIRFVRLKTPIPVDLQLLREKDAMLAELREVRVRTLALIEETRNRDLSAYTGPHPFLGPFTTSEWF